MLEQMAMMNKYSALLLPATFGRSAIGQSLGTYDARVTAFSPPLSYSSMIPCLQRDLDVLDDAVLPSLFCTPSVPLHEQQLSEDSRVLLQRGIEDVIAGRTRPFDLAELSADDE